MKLYKLLQEELKNNKEKEEEKEYFFYIIEQIKNLLYNHELFIIPKENINKINKNRSTNNLSIRK